MSTSPPYPGSGEPPRPDAGPPYGGPPPAPGQHPGDQHPGGQYPGGQHSGGQYPGGQHSGGQYPGGQYGPPLQPGQYPGGGQYGAQPQPGQYPGGPHPGSDLYPGGQYPAGAYSGGPAQFGASPYAAADPLVATSFSDWWAKVIGVLQRSWQPLLIIQLATVVPGMLIAAIVTAAAGTDSTAMSIGAAIVGLVGALILFVVALLAQGASVYVVGKQAAGQEIVGAGPALTFAAGRALPLLGWGLLAGLLVMLGLIALIVPGVYLIVVFGATLTGVIMFERAGIGRSFQLVNPAFGQTLGRLLTF